MAWVIEALRVGDALGPSRRLAFDRAVNATSADADLVPLVPNTHALSPDGLNLRLGLAWHAAAATAAALQP